MAESETPTVLHVLAPAPFGGLETVVQTLAAGQREIGLRVEVAALLDQHETCHPFVASMTSRRVPVHVTGFPPRSYLRERRFLRGICEALGPTVVHTHGYRADVLGMSTFHRVRAACVSTVHGFTGGGRKNRFYERLQLRSLRRFDRVVAVSRPLVELLAASGVSRSRIVCLPNAWGEWEKGVLKGKKAARQALGLQAPGPVIGWVGRLSSEKGPELLLEAAALMESPALEVSLIGDGREEPALRQQARSLHIDSRVHFHGRVPAAASVFRAFDVFVLSSRTEGTPIVLFEAMAAGVPIVATAVGGVPDVVSEREALLVRPGDPAALADAIRRTLEDPAAAATRVRAAEDRLAARYAVGPWVDRYTEIYRSVAR